MSLRKVGGLTFISLGRVRISYCVARPVPPAPVISAARLALALRTEA